MVSIKGLDSFFLHIVKRGVLRSYVLGIALIFIFNLSSTLPAYAQLGDPDPDFLTGSGFNNTVKAVHMLPGGKMYVVGYFTSYKGLPHNHIVKLNADGTVDTSFQPVGGTANGANGNIETIVVQSDGKIIIGGAFTAFNGFTRNRIARLNSDGSLDPTFNAGLAIPDAELGFDGLVTKILLQSDGKILVSGFFQTYNRSTRQRIARLQSSGAVDPFFDTSQGANSNIYAMALQSDGKIVIGGFFTSFAGTGRNKIARLYSNGNLDLTFNPGTGINSEGFVRDIAIRSDSKMFVVGDFSIYNDAIRSNIALVNANGSLDMNAFSNGAGTNGIIVMAKIIGERLFIGGLFSNFRGNQTFNLAVLNASGAYYDGEYPHGIGLNGEVYDVAPFTSHYIFVGKFTQYLGYNHNRIVRALMTYPAPTVNTILPNLFSNETTRDITFDINGTNLLPTSTVSISGNGVAFSSVQYVSREKLRVTARLTAGASVGYRSVTVRNPSPGGGSFVVASGIRVVYPKPTLTSVTPSSLPIGSTNTALTIIGTNFNPQTQLFIDSDAVQIQSTTYVSSTQLTARVNVGNQAQVGNVATTVKNPSDIGGGGFSNAINLSLQNPVPAISSISPNNGSQGKTQLVIISGTNFVNGSQVTVSGEGVTINSVTFVSPIQLQVLLNIAQNAATGIRTLSVTNPAPGGGSSNSTNFTVNLNNPVPTLTSISPSAVNQGQSALVKFTGTNIQASTTVGFNIQGITVSNVNRESSTVLWANITAAPTASLGTHPMWLFTPQPGGGASEALAFKVLIPENPLPAITTISPNTFALGSSTNVVITGTNFIPNSILTIEGLGVTSSDYSVVSDTQISLKISVNGTTTAGNRAIRITNPAPGGGVSNASNLLIQSNRAPTLTAIPDIEFLHSAPQQTIQLSGIGPGLGESSQNLTITASVDDPILIPTLSVEYTNPQSVGQLKFQNDRRRIGSTFIRVRIKDNGGINNGGIDSLIRVFKVTVNLNSNLEQDPDKPLSYNLAQNYPNPFNPSTTLQYTMASSGHVRIQLFNAMGILIDTLIDEVRLAGTHELLYDASRLTSGMYFYRMQTESGYLQSRKMTLLK